MWIFNLAPNYVIVFVYEDTVFNFPWFYLVQNLDKVPTYLLFRNANIPTSVSVKFLNIPVINFLLGIKSC